MIAVPKNNNRIFIGFTILFILSAAMAVYNESYYIAAIPFLFLFFYAGWEMINTVFLLLLFSLSFSTEYQITEALGTDIPDEFLMLFVAFLFFSYWVYKPYVLPRSVLSHPIIIILMAGFLWSIVSAIFSTDPTLSLKFLLAKSWYFGAFVLAPVIAFRNKKMIRNAAIALLIAMLLVVIITLIRHFKDGYAFAAINYALTPFFRNHVNYSAMLVCVIPIVIAAVKQKRWMIIILSVLLVALFLSYARGAWLALFIGIATAWLIKQKKIVFAYTLFIAVTVSAVLWIKSNDRYLQYVHDYRTTIWHADFREHLAATYQLKDVSTAERFYRWIAGVRMIKENWLTGYGPNSFYNNYQSYTIPAFKTWVSNNPEHSTVHNYFLLITIEQGIPGLILFLLLVGLLLYYAQYLYHRIEDKFYKTVAITTGVILSMILTVNFLSDLIETDKIGSLFYLCLSTLVVVSIKSSRARSMHPANHSPTN